MIKKDLGGHSVLILLSTYNGEKYLQTQLDSLKNQIGVDLTVMVRDDGSKDRTLEILEKYTNLMKLSYVKADNVGSTKSFLELLGSCPLNYEYYAFCDQDDYWHKDKMIAAIHKLESIPKDKPALYYSGQRLVDADMQPIYDHNLDTKRNEYANAIFNQMAGCTSVFNLALLRCAKQVLGGNLVPGFHDSALYRICVLADGNVICDSAGKIDYRQHGSNVVGLDYSLKGKLNKVMRYIKPGEIQKDLAFIYDHDLSWCDPEKKEFFNNIRKSNSSIKSKICLLIHQGRVNFHSPILRGIYNLKILTSNM